MSSTIITKIPPNSQILAFRRTMNYPKPGSIISIDSKIIEDHVSSIEENRDEYDRQQFKITSKLSIIDPSSTSIFYKTHVEIKYSINSDMMLIVDSIETTKKGCMLKCFLQMIVWPNDVKIEDRFIYISDSNAYVVEPIICSQIWKYSSSRPNNTTTFGIKSNKNGHKNLWQVYEKLGIMPKEFVNIAFECGFKEFSYISKIPQINDTLDLIEENQFPVEINKHEEKQNIHKNLDLDIDDTEKDFYEHPMSEFVQRLYEITCSTMHDNGILTSHEFRENLRWKFINLTNNSDMSINFYDDTEA